jgi:hypothetical protein
MADHLLLLPSESGVPEDIAKDAKRVFQRGMGGGAGVDGNVGILEAE